MNEADREIENALSKSGVIDITTTGRVSKKGRRIEIVFHNIGGRLFISGMPRREPRDWLRNLEADPRFTFHLKERVHADLPATARVITDEAERRAVLAGIATAWRRRDLEEMVRYSPLIEVSVNRTAA